MYQQCGKNLTWKVEIKSIFWPKHTSLEYACCVMLCKPGKAFEGTTFGKAQTLRLAQKREKDPALCISGLRFVTLKIHFAIIFAFEFFFAKFLIALFLMSFLF
jgi:hypothetical protein